MDAPEVVDLYRTLEKLGVRIWIDGGWGIDALLGKQTRAHADLDYKDVTALCEKFGMELPEEYKRA
jgi:lincosamide nucleotidyltransferase A/C/D/E